MTDPSRARTDDPLRANVRLLGELLGRVIVEQDGEPVMVDNPRWK